MGALGDRLIHFHIHDVRRSDFRDHRGLGNLDDNGVVDFPRLTSQLSRTPYNGLWILELEEPDREEALTRSRAYLAALT